MSLQNYRQAQLQADNPRATEYQVFAQVTRDLMDAGTPGSETNLAKAVHANRRLWLALQADCADETNKLTEQTRAGIISLAIWVDKQSRAVLNGGADVGSLVEINRTIMAGLVN